MRQSTILEIRIGPCGHTFNDACSYITLSSASPITSHQFLPQIHHFSPQVQQVLQIILPPLQMHQPLHQVLNRQQSHQPSQQITHHNLHLNVPQFQGHINFRPINHSHTSQSTPISTPPLVVPVQLPHLISVFSHYLSY